MTAFFLGALLVLLLFPLVATPANALELLSDDRRVEVTLRPDDSQPTEVTTFAPDAPFGPFVGPGSTQDSSISIAPDGLGFDVSATAQTIGDIDRHDGYQHREESSLS